MAISFVPAKAPDGAQAPMKVMNIHMATVKVYYIYSNVNQKTHALHAYISLVLLSVGLAITERNGRNPSSHFQL